MRHMHMGAPYMGSSCPYKTNNPTASTLDLSGMAPNGNGMHGMMHPMMMSPMAMGPMAMSPMGMSPMQMSPMMNMMGNYDLARALDYIKEAVRGEKEDELFYNWLIDEAPTDAEKRIIASIRDDELKHNRMFKEIYRALTGETVTVDQQATFTEPASYLEGIEKALFGELAAFEKYRFIYLNLPYRVYRDQVFEIMTDELKHATKYNYLYTKNK